MNDSVQDKRPKIFWSYVSLVREHGPEIGPYGIATYDALSIMGGESGVCCPAIRTIATMIGASETAVKDSLKKLAELGYISIEPRYKDGNPMERTSNQYTLLPQGVGRQKTQGGSPGDYEVVMKKIKKAYNDTFALYPTPMIEEQLIGLLDEYGADKLIDAFKECSMYGGRTLAYVRSCLRDQSGANEGKRAPESNGNGQVRDYSVGRNT